MIDFACKHFDIDEIIKCGLGLTKAEMRLLHGFLAEGPNVLTTATLAKKNNLDLSTVQKGVKKLYEKGVLVRSQRNSSVGGYVYVYALKPKKEIRATIKEIIRAWEHKVEAAIDRW